MQKSHQLWQWLHHSSKLNNGIQFTTELFERFEHVLKKTFLTLKETNTSSFVVKLHPSLQKNNLQIKKFIEEFDQNIIVKQFSSIVDDIHECDIIINIFTEIYGSTVMLEGLIMKKPILNISLDQRSYKFEFEKRFATRSNNISK